MLYSAGIALVCMASAIQGLNLYSTKKQPCFNISVAETPLMDPNFSLSLNPMYYPISSTVDLYRASATLLQKDPKDIPIASVYYDACLNWRMHADGTITLKGFNGLTTVFETKPLKDNVNEYIFAARGGDKEKNVYGGTAYTTLTDNKSFFFTVTCFPDGQVGFGVGTNTPTLPEKTKKLVLDHALSFGFKKEDFTELRYDNCKI